MIERDKRKLLRDYSKRACMTALMRPEFVRVQFRLPDDPTHPIAEPRYAPSFMSWYKWMEHRRWNLRVIKEARRTGEGKI